MHQLFHGDCLDIMSGIPEKSIDMIFTDLPYGTTRNDWDHIIPLKDYIMVNGKPLTRDEYLLHSFRSDIPYAAAITEYRKKKQPGLWTHYKRIIKENGCIALFAQCPFDTILGASNLPWLRYEWIIEKTKATGYLNAKKTPMKAHEKILIFYKQCPVYHPQMTEGHPPVHNFTKKSDSTCYGTTHTVSGGGSTSRYPRDVLTFKWDTQTSAIHSTQKPISLLEYFILTYTNPGDTILDSCMGSGSTGVACINTGRNFIGIEKVERIFIDAAVRIEDKIRTTKEGVPYHVEEHQTFIQSSIEGF